MDNKDNPKEIQAFPSNGYIYDPNKQETMGMTLRDYFAGQALGDLVYELDPVRIIARDAYRLADAMLKERLERNKKDNA